MFPISKSSRAWLLVFGLALVVRLGYCAWVNTKPYPFESRYREYIISGKGLIAHQTFVSPLTAEAGRIEPSALMPPLYSVWVAGVYALLGPESRVSVYALQCANALAAALACGLVFRIADSIAGRRAAWIAGLVASLNPAFLGFTDYVWDTCFFTFAVTLSIWLAQELRHRRASTGHMFGYGLWLGFVALLNPSLTLTYPLLVLFAIRPIGTIWSRPVLTRIAVSIAGWMIAIVPWTVRNYVQIGTLSYVRSGLSLELWHGVAPEAESAGAATLQTYFPLNNPEEAKRAAELGEPEYIRQRGVLARDAIAADPIRYVRLVGMRTVDFWLGSGVTHAGPHGRFWPATRTRQLVMLVYSLECAVILAGLFGGTWRFKEVRFLVGVIAIFSVVYCITQVQVRFRVPVEPLIAVLMGITLARHLSSSTLRDSGSRGHRFYTF